MNSKKLYGVSRCVSYPNPFQCPNTPNNNVLIRSGEALGIGRSRNMLYSGFDILTRSVFWSANWFRRSDNTDVICPKSTGSLMKSWLRRFRDFTSEVKKRRIGDGYARIKRPVAKSTLNRLSHQLRLPVPLPLLDFF